MPDPHAAYSTRQHSAGFTILEVGIVIMILGLAMGGIVMGSAMIRQAELRSVVTDVDRIKKAIQGFQDKFLTLPGDMTNATTFWGSWAYAGYYHEQKATNNGNGDGIIGPWSDATYYNESFTAWQHLSNAGLLEGLYTGAKLLPRQTDFNLVFLCSPSGTPCAHFDYDFDGDLDVDASDFLQFVNRYGAGAGNAVSFADPSLNVPPSKVSGAGFSLTYFAPGTGNAEYFAIDTPQHALFFGKPYVSRTTEKGALSSTEAAEIDAKMDDGVPYTGTVMSHKEGTVNTGCVAAGDTPSNYLNTNTTNPTCALIFLLNL